MSGYMPANDALERLGGSFKAAMVAMRRLRGRDTHRTGELSYAQYGLLFGLSDRSELSARELATAADLSPATVTQMLDSLEEAGFVARVRSERDKRVVLVSLTERGRALITARRSHFESRWRTALAEFSDDELLTAAAVLDRLRAMLDELAADPEAIPGEGPGAAVREAATTA
jgi:DNA-binding MarR family transcriptional regulator